VQLPELRLDLAKHDLLSFRVLPITAVAAAEFGRLLQNKKLKKIGRADPLANRATLVTRN